MKKINTLLGLVLLSLVFIANSYGDVKSTATITGTANGANVSLGAPFNMNTWGGTFNGTVNSTAVKFYCIDLRHYLEYNAPYSDIKLTKKHITYILNNYYPFKSLPYTGSLDVNTEAAAIQLSIWHYSDTLNLDVCSPSNVVNRAKQIVADAEANAPGFVPVKTLVIYVPTQSMIKGNVVKFRVEVYDELNRPVPNVTVSLSTTAGTLSASSITTNASGYSDTLTLTPGSGTLTATITANANVTIPQGTEYHHVANPNGKQKLVIATPVVANKNTTKTVNWFEPADLSLVKLASATLVSNNDIVKYYLKVKNNGSNLVKDIVVLDKLPSTLTYQSSTGNGSYDPVTGYWTIPTLAGGDTAVITITTKVTLSNPIPFDLGPAKNYNVFVLHDFKEYGSDVEGRVAVANDATFGSFAIGQALPPHSGDVLVVGRRLTFTTGRVANGKVVYGQFIDTTHANLADDGISQGTPIDFPAAQNYLINLSSQLAAFAPNGTVVKQWNQLFLTGTDNSINYFNVNGADMTGISNFVINVPAGSAALINISGENIQWNNGFNFTGVTKDKILLNFYQAKTLKIAYIGIKGCVLAPYALLDFASGLIEGQVIVKDIIGQGQFNHNPFAGQFANQITINNVANILDVNNNIDNDNMLMSFAKITPNSPTGIKSESSVPTEFRLLQNYPNPFNPSTMVRFEIPSKEFVSIAIFSITGQKVADLYSGSLEAGAHQIEFNAKNLNSGIYIIQFNAGKFSSAKKMVLMK